MPRVTSDLPLLAASSVRELPHIKGRTLADQHFDIPGRIDLLLGEDALRDVYLPGESKGPPGTPTAWLTVFGWVLKGCYTPDEVTSIKEASVCTASASEATQSTDELFTKFWELEEEPRTAPALIPEEEKVQDHYQSTHSYDSQAGRYMVSLPRKEGNFTLGESRLNTARANERSLLRKGTWDKFQDVIKEYISLQHAQPVTAQEMTLPSESCYYMPMHGVYKDSSSTTKLRVVFDASARTTTSTSLNDLLAVRPTLHPTLDKILLKFRSYRVALSGDISKMYREVLLSPEDRQLHRFLWRPYQDQPFVDYCMKRVTTGVAASPYLAVKILQQAAKDFAGDFPQASWHVENSFYVDDLLGGADSEEEALDLYRNLRQVLGKGGFNLRKWRSSSAEVLASIPDKLLEALPTQDLVDRHSAKYPKTLGVAWDSRSDTMATHIELPTGYSSTKRGVVSDIARTFDVLGWLAPAILPMKLLYRELWKQKIGWDEEVPGDIKSSHKKWREELPLLAEIQLPRSYYSERHHLTIELHGFSDASQEAYSAVVYLRATYKNSPPTCRLVVAKTRVAPLKQLTIPRLELCGATLLSKLLNSTRQTLDIPLDATHAWCDSTIVLAWLDGSPRRYQTYVGNRISTVTSLIPPSARKHVPTKDNPADCASRGMAAEELKTHSLWWHGPSWLHHLPVSIPRQPHKSELRELQDTEARPSVCHVLQAAPAKEARYSSYRTLLHVTSWVIRYANNFLSVIRDKAYIRGEDLTVPDIEAAEVFLCKSSQKRSFPAELHCLKAHPPKPIFSNSHLLVLHPRMACIQQV